MQIITFSIIHAVIITSSNKFEGIFFTALLFPLNKFVLITVN